MDNNKIKDESTTQSFSWQDPDVVVRSIDNWGDSNRVLVSLITSVNDRHWQMHTNACYPEINLSTLLYLIMRIITIYWGKPPSKLLSHYCYSILKLKWRSLKITYMPIPCILDTSLKQEASLQMTYHLVSFDIPVPVSQQHD